MCLQATAPEDKAWAQWDRLASLTANGMALIVLFVVFVFCLFVCLFFVLFSISVVCWGLLILNPGSCIHKLKISKSCKVCAEHQFHTLYWNYVKLHHLYKKLNRHFCIYAIVTRRYSKSFSGDTILALSWETHLQVTRDNKIMNTWSLINNIFF